MRLRGGRIARTISGRSLYRTRGANPAIRLNAGKRNMKRAGSRSYALCPASPRSAHMQNRKVDVMEQNPAFWQALETLVADSKLILDRPKGSAHPRYPGFVYAVDYGFLSGTASMDGGGIDVWVGTDARRQIDAIVCTIDLLKRDSEIKILIGCTEAEKTAVLAFHSNSEFMKGVLIRREADEYPHR